MLQDVATYVAIGVGVLHFMSLFRELFGPHIRRAIGR